MMSAGFEAFFDDAAIFPPGNAPVDVAVKQHLCRRGTPDGAFVGPLVCDVARLGELTRVALRPVAVSLVGERDAVVRAADRLVGGPVRAVAIELRGPVDDLPPVPVPSIAVEMPWGSGFEVPVGALLKLRCGGERVPTVDELAAAVQHCVDHDQPFKLTAGLHAAVAHDGAHGFVNVMAAVVAAQRGLDPAPVLAATDPAVLDLTTLGASRRLFHSIGTCSIDEPLGHLHDLGLLR